MTETTPAIVNETTPVSSKKEVNHIIPNEQSNNSCHKEEEEVSKLSTPTKEIVDNNQPVNACEDHHNLYLEFTDNVDLQTRIVLLPLNDSDCTGAVVASYTPEALSQSNCKEQTQIITVEDKMHQRSDSELSQNLVDLEARESAVCPLSSNDPLQESSKTTTSQKEIASVPSEHNAKQNKPKSSLQQENFVGCILLGIKGIDTQPEQEALDWKTTDFTQILSILKDAPAPIVLKFEKKRGLLEDSPDVRSQTMTGDTDSTITSECSSVSESGHSDSRKNDTLKTDIKMNVATKSPERKKTTDEIRGRLSAWGSRVAAEAQRRAEKALSEIKLSQNEPNDKGTNVENVPSQIAVQKETDQAICSMFLHNVRENRYIPLLMDEKKQAITNSSVLSIRQSISPNPCPKGYSFQWFRSNTNSDCWYKLEGATFPTFQPSANDVGHTVKCVVTVNDEDKNAEESVTCLLPCRIKSDLPLLNGARSSFLPGGGVVSSVGACFSGFVGIGSKAHGKKFKIHLEMSSNGCIMSIVLVSGTKAMLCHNQNEPIVKAKAMAIPSLPRELDIIFTQKLSSSAILLSSFCEEGNRLRLQARNRTMRESFLLALGIANFSGAPSDLRTDTMLFDNLTISESLSEKPIVDEDDTRHPDGNNSTTDKGDDVDVTSLASDGILSKSILDESMETCSGRGGDEKKMQCLEQAIQKDMKLLREKLGARDRQLSDLRQRLRLSEVELEQARKYGYEAERERDGIKAKYGECCRNLQLSQKRLENQADEILTLKNDLNIHISKAEEERIIYTEKEQAYIKSMKVMENEKAVLSAAVEARTSKLKKMEGLKDDLASAQQKVSNGKIVQKKLDDMVVRFQQMQVDLSKKEVSEMKTNSDLMDTRAELEALKRQLFAEKKNSQKYQSDLEQSRIKCNKFRVERNTLKQKSDTLAKEISRICHGGKTVSDIVTIIETSEARKMEVEILKQQKRKAEDSLEVYRNSFEMSLRAHENVNVTKDAILALEQKAELERVLKNLTEYVNAKEMQLETMKEVNQSLTEELRLLTLSQHQST